MKAVGYGHVEAGGSRAAAQSSRDKLFDDCEKCGMMQ